MNIEPQDSAPDTRDHILRVRELLYQAAVKLDFRAAGHDASKLEEPEKSGFDRLKALALSGMAYGSEEYRACLRAEKPAIDHHYAANSHHPEYYPKREASSEVRNLLGDLAHFSQLPEDHPSVQYVKHAVAQEEASVNGMSLFDLLEMLVDWKAASERMKDGGDIWRSIEINTGRFNLSPQLVSILRNTAREMAWPVKTATPPDSSAQSETVKGSSSG